MRTYIIPNKNTGPRDTFFPDTQIKTPDDVKQAARDASVQRMLIEQASRDGKIHKLMSDQSSVNETIQEMMEEQENRDGKIQETLDNIMELLKDNDRENGHDSDDESVTSTRWMCCEWF